MKAVHIDARYTDVGLTPQHRRLPTSQGYDNHSTPDPIGPVLAEKVSGAVTDKRPGALGTC
jgi:hypothetical protein